jgi:hypothetical protein
MTERPPLILVNREDNLLLQLADMDDDAAL